MTDRNVIVETVDGALKAMGLIKHSGSWYLRTADTVTVLNLQKSQYSRRYYLNFGVWILSVAETDFPKPNHCHLVGRVSNLIKQKYVTERLEALLDLELPISDPERRSELKEILDEQLPSLLDLSSSVEKLRSGSGLNMVASLGIRAAVVDLFPPR